MAEQKPQQDRTEEATPKRRQDARKKGDVPRSRELTMTGVMLAGTSGLLFLSGQIGGKLLQNMEEALSLERALILDVNLLTSQLADYLLHALLAIMPLGLITIAAAFFGSALLGGWSFSLKAVAFKAERLNPAKGLKRVFSANGLNELVKAVAKFALVAIAAVTWLWSSMGEVLSLGQQPIQPAIHAALRLCGISFLIVSTTLIAIALVDVPFQLWNYNKKLKMTRQEVKDEFKETEGRPEVKAKIRSLQQQVAHRRMMEELPEADVVITNPTHYAVALKYTEDAMRAPKVIAKGKDLMARRIREVAEEHEVPLFSAPPLARALYGSAKLGQEIPAGLYTAVAQVLAYIFQVRDSVRGAFDIEPPVLPEIDESLYT